MPNDKWLNHPKAIGVVQFGHPLTRWLHQEKEAWNLLY
jgi:hypothetical protein